MDAQEAARNKGWSAGWPTALVLWGLLGAGLCLLLLPHWSSNPDLSHGWFAPLVFGLMLRESREARRMGGSPQLWWGVAALCSASSTGALIAASAYTLAFGFGHPLTAWFASLSFGLLTLALVAGAQATGMKLVRPGWAAMAAAVSWLLCSPMPPGSYARLSSSLQLGVSEGVLHALSLLGVPAVRHGNIIELSQCGVGVEEACSGVRSLLACAYAGLALSTLLVSGFWRRLLLLSLAIPLALAGNFLRSLALTLLADSGVDISGIWHDATGYAVLGGSVILLCLLGLRLSRARVLRKSSVTQADPLLKARGGLGAWLLTVPATVAVVGVAILQTQSLSPEGLAADPARVAPAQLAGWQVIDDPSITRYAPMLGTRSLVQRDYEGLLANGERVRINLYVATWEAGQASASTVALHTPEVCWPGEGWQAMGGEAYAGPTPQHAVSRVFRHPSGLLQHVSYWHLQGGRPLGALDPREVWSLLKQSLSGQNSASGPQLFLRIASTRAWTEIAETEPVRQALREAGISDLPPSSRNATR